MKQYTVTLVDTQGANDEQIAIFQNRNDAVKYARRYIMGLVKPVSDDYKEHVVVVYNEATTTEIWAKPFYKYVFEKAIA